MLDTDHGTEIIQARLQRLHYNYLKSIGLPSHHNAITAI